MTAPLPALPEQTPPGFPKPKQKNVRLKTDDVALRNRRNTRYGHAKQAVVRKWLEHITGTQARFQGRKANEEDWTHLPVRCEVKAGAQVGPVWTAYAKQENQAEQAKAFGDIRPFIGVSSPEAMTDFLITIRASKFHEVCEAMGYYRVNENGGL